MEEKSVVSYLNYGKIEVRLKEVLDAKGFTRNYLSKSTNTRFEVINRWYSGNVEKMDLDILARICYVFDCKPEDIIKYR